MDGFRHIPLATAPNIFYVCQKRKYNEIERKASSQSSNTKVCWCCETVKNSY